MRGVISEENVHSQVLIYTTCNGDLNRTDASQYGATVIGCSNCLHLHSHLCSQLLPSRSRPVQNPYPGVYGPRIDPKAPRRPKELSERRMMGLIRIFLESMRFVIVCTACNLTDHYTDTGHHYIKTIGSTNCLILASASAPNSSPHTWGSVDRNRLKRAVYLGARGRSQRLCGGKNVGARIKGSCG